MLRARDNHVPLYMMYLLAWDPGSPRTNYKLLFPGHFAIAFCFYLRTGESATSLRAVITSVSLREPQMGHGLLGA